MTRSNSPDIKIIQGFFTKKKEPDSKFELIKGGQQRNLDFSGIKIIFIPADAVFFVLLRFWHVVGNNEGTEDSL